MSCGSTPRAPATFIAVVLRGGRSAYPLVVGTIRSALAPERAQGGAAPPEGQEAELTLIGQFAGRCIIAQEGEELIILDQHGAHERILYERLLKDPEAAPVTLPIPIVVRLPEDLAPEAWGFELELKALGFEFEPFGEGTVRVASAPETVTDPEAALLAALRALAGGEDLAKALACKGSTRFGENLSREEMVVLLKDWAATDFKECMRPSLTDRAAYASTPRLRKTMPSR